MTTRNRILALAALACLLPATGALARGPEQFTPTPGVAAAALAGPMAEIEEVIYSTRSLVGNLHYYENYGRKYGDEFRLAEGGTALRALELRTGKVRTILEDPDGAIRDPILSWDATKILISYRKGGTNFYNLYEIDLDGSNLRRITDAPFDDVEPCYLPDGGIAFISSRCNRRVPCWSTQVGILYRCEADGSDLRPLSAGIEHENTPWVLPDGRVLYTRWEYVDRTEIDYHHLWTVNPDGTRHQAYYGNMHRHGNCVAMLDAKPIPGTTNVVCTFTFHNTAEHAGPITIIDVDRGPDHVPSARTLLNAKTEALPGAKLKYNSEQFRDPYPISPDCFLVASQQSLYILNGQGQAEPIHSIDHENPRMWLHEPRPVMPRPKPPVIPSAVDPSMDHGVMVLADVTRGRNMKGVKPGQIRSLLVMEELAKPVSFTVDPDMASLTSTFIFHRIMGTVPVEEDGSAKFKVPAGRPVFFVALDKDGHSVKRMMSFTNTMPGEVTGCVGCHEARTLTPPKAIDGRKLLAMRKAPAEIQPMENIPEVIDYVRDIQPIWDKHCVSCHNVEKYAGKLSLLGHRAPEFTQSYLNIHWSRLLAVNFQGKGNADPYQYGGAHSRLYKKVAGEHHGVKLPDHELRMVEMWIESSAAFSATYAILGTNGARVSPPKKVLESRCGSCHKAGEVDRRWMTGRNRITGRWYDLTEPDKSLALLAPLSKDAGGLGLCKQREAKQLSRYEGDEPPAEVFKSKDDPDYQAIREAIVKGAAWADKFAWPFEEGFRPDRRYVEEMQRFGLLDKDYDRSRDTIDPYELDRRYWRSFWLTPENE